MEGAPLRPLRRPFVQDRDLGVVRARRHPPLAAVDDHHLAVAEAAEGAPDLPHHGDLQRPRDDGGVAGGRAFLQDHGAQPRPVVLQQLRGAEIARDDHHVVAVAAGRAPFVLAGEVIAQPVAEFVEVGQALAQIGVGRRVHADSACPPGRGRRRPRR